ncbi:hypothetical protein [Paenibacillus lautus]|uniref:hypothetical protein n=1 Tax=Paenibacillus lautus TaxID=1401 RepID=UPI001C7CE24E|nr:hypothetical protein [Paenibacillus lautus]MBX4152288.1 hypothetical protein [Paenibacillus lautus]
MEKYKVFSGLGGGFGGANYIDTLEFNNYDEALQWAYDAACEEYEDYVGLYGLRTIEEIIEEDEVDEDEAKSIYIDEREGWLDYRVKLDDGLPE